MGKRVTIESLALAEEAYGLWNQGIPMRQIGEMLEVPASTVTRWSKMYRWQERAEKIADKVSETVDETIADIKARQVSQVRNMMEGVFEAFALSENGSKLDMAKALEILVRIQSLLTGEPTSIGETRTRQEFLDLTAIEKAFMEANQGRMVVTEEPAHRVESEKGREVLKALKDSGFELEEDASMNPFEEMPDDGEDDAAAAVDSADETTEAKEADVENPYRV